MATVSSSGLNPDRIKNDPVFERTRENMAEFTRAGKAAKFTRMVFREVMVNAKDRVTQARLLKVFSRILATDTTNGRGERTVNNGELAQLLGFNFNVRAGLKEVFYKHFAISFDRTTGQVTINIPSYVPRIMVQGAKGCDYYSLVLGAAAVDFDKEQYQFQSQATSELPWNHDPTTATSLTVTLPANSTQTVLVVLGIEYYQRVSAKSYALKSGEHNAASIVLVDPAP